MRVVIQRVTEAWVSIDEKAIAGIAHGLLVLVGIEDNDTSEDVEWLSSKIVQLRIFNDQNGVMNLSVKETGGEILVISQFTLHAKTKKGNRPSYINAAKHETAILIYETFIKQLSADLEKTVKTGEFGAMMRISLINDGPVTIWIDTKNKE